MPENGAVLDTKYENYKESLQNLQECVFPYVVVNYKKGVDLEPLIRKLEDVDISIKEPTAPTVTGNRAPPEISKTRYELELTFLNWTDILKYTITKL